MSINTNDPDGSSSEVQDGKTSRKTPDLSDRLSKEAQGYIEDERLSMVHKICEFIDKYGGIPMEEITNCSGRMKNAVYGKGGGIGLTYSEMPREEIEEIHDYALKFEKIYQDLSISEKDIYIRFDRKKYSGPGLTTYGAKRKEQSSEDYDKMKEKYNSRIVPFSKEAKDEIEKHNLEVRFIVALDYGDGLKERIGPVRLPEVRLDNDLQPYEYKIPHTTHYETVPYKSLTIEEYIRILKDHPRVWDGKKRHLNGDRTLT